MADKTFVDGLYGDKPHEKAPDFVVAKLAIKSEKLIDFLKEHTNSSGYVNIDMLKGKEDKFNFVLNTWKKKSEDDF